MSDNEQIYEVTGREADVPNDLHLVAALTGFADAGGTVEQLNKYFLSNIRHEELLRFRNDQLLDYRARRPLITFDGDHLTAFDVPRLSLHLAYDELDHPFLLLIGYEPDFKWEAFTDALVAIVQRYKVRDTTWVHSIPMPVPHTRPVSALVSGNRKDLAQAISVWRPKAQAPSNVLHFLEYKLSEAGERVVGFVQLIPHYLSDTEFPGATASALDNICAATGLLLSTADLRAEDRNFLANIDNQVNANPELAKLVHTLEIRHDSYMEDNRNPDGLTGISGELPTADEIAAELEKFLASQHPSEDGPEEPPLV